MARRRVPVGKNNRPVVDPRPEDVDDLDDLTCDCPLLDPADWDDVESDWSDIAFLVLNLGAVFGVPMGYAGLTVRLREEAERRRLTLPDDGMVLVGEGRFRRPVLVEVEAGPDADTEGLVHPGGFAYSRLLPAPFGDIKRIFAETRELATRRYGRAPDAMWMWYLTCRECSAARNFETLFVAQYLPTGARP